MTKLVTFRSVSNGGTPKELSISVEQLIQLLNFYCLIGELFDAQNKDSSVVHGLIKGSTIADFGSEYGGVNRVKKALQRWTSAKEM